MKELIDCLYYDDYPEIPMPHRLTDTDRQMIFQTIEDTYNDKGYFVQLISEVGGSLDGVMFDLEPNATRDDRWDFICTFYVDQPIDIPESSLLIISKDIEAIIDELRVNNQFAPLSIDVDDIDQHIVIIESLDPPEVIKYHVPNIS